MSPQNIPVSLLSEKKIVSALSERPFIRGLVLNRFWLINKKIDGEFFCPVDMLLRHPRQSIISQKKWERSFRRAFYKRFSAEQLLAYKQKNRWGIFLSS